MAKNPKANPHPLAPTVVNMNQMPAPPRVAGPQKGTLRPRGGPKGGGDPSMGTANHPRQIQERMGARRRIEVKMPGPSLPEAAATQANGKVMSSVMGQSRNFWGGQATHG